MVAVVVADDGREAPLHLQVLLAAVVAGQRDPADRLDRPEAVVAGRRDPADRQGLPEEVEA